MPATGIRALNRKQESEWQIRRSSETHTAFRQCSLIRKPARMMPPLSLSGSAMRSAECGGPSGIRYPPGLAFVHFGRPNANGPARLLSDAEYPSDQLAQRDRDKRAHPVATP